MGFKVTNKPAYFVVRFDEKIEVELHDVTAGPARN